MRLKGEFEIRKLRAQTFLIHGREPEVTSMRMSHNRVHPDPQVLVFQFPVLNLWFSNFRFPGPYSQVPDSFNMASGAWGHVETDKRLLIPFRPPLHPSEVFQPENNVNWTWILGFLCHWRPLSEPYTIGMGRWLVIGNLNINTGKLMLAYGDFSFALNSAKALRVVGRNVAQNTCFLHRKYRQFSDIKNY